MIKGIKDIKVPFTTKDGKESTYTAWGFSTKATAEKWLKEIDGTEISVETLNS